MARPLELVCPVHFNAEVIGRVRRIAEANGLTLDGVLHSALRTLLERYKGIDAGGGLPDVLSFREIARTQGSLFEQLPTSQVESAGADLRSSQTEYCLEISESPSGGVAGYWRYRGSFLDEVMLRRFARHFENLLAAMAAEPDRWVWAIPLLTPEELTEITRWNETATNYPREAMVHELFEEQADARPAATAVIREGEGLSYQQLNERANQLAHCLQQRGVAPGSVVGIALDRSIPMVVAMIAVLKTGACYLPLDPSYPRDRLRFMVEDSGARILLTDQAGCAVFVGLELDIIDLDRERESIGAQPIGNLTRQNAAGALAYIMYTSGSTGTPKGAEVLHRGIVRLVKNTDYVQLDATETIAQISKFSFDAITFEVWGALLNGGRLVILSYETILSPALLAEAFRKWKITSLFLTAALFNVMAKRKPDAFDGLRNVLAGGDVVSPESVRIVCETAPPHRLLNAYGPTECTTFSCCHPIERVADGGIPIGRPIANSEAYLLDRFRQPVPVGVLGEIYLGGDGLARGYRNRPELTGQRFVPHALKPGERLYKTGDKGRYRQDGSIEFAGRTDHQVKLRGHRIELGEIEAALRKHPEVADSVVITSPRTSGELRLIAYVDRRSDCHPNEEQLKSFLSNSLPAFMVPAQIAVLDEFPLTPEGKIDRKALPAFTSVATVPAQLPGNEIESEIAAIWSSLLGRNTLGMDDNFFDLGGSSLLLVTVQGELETRLDAAIAVTDLFRFPTIRRLAQFLSDGANSDNRLASAQQRARRQKQILRNLRKQPVAS